MREQEHGVVYIKLARILKQEQQALERLNREYRTCPKGQLCIIKKGKYNCFYVNLPQKQKAIKKDKSRVYSLARKKVIVKEIGKKQAECDILQQAMSRIIDEETKLNKKHNTLTYQRLPILKERERIFLPRDEYNWKHNQYQVNPYKPESLIYTTNGGVKVRSKSERVIANILEDYDITYLYETKLVIEGAAYYPDFVIRKKDGAIILWEHLGLMNQEDYYLRACQKINKYRQAGFVQHRNLICTYEQDIESQQVLVDIIETFIL